MREAASSAAPRTGAKPVTDPPLCPRCYAPGATLNGGSYCANANCDHYGKWMSNPAPTPPAVPRDAAFDGETHDPALDRDRLKRQIGRVWEAMQDRKWRTLAQLAAATGDPEASVSARLRDLRKPRFGGYNIENRRVTDGLWEYRLHG